tara:strand:- start:140 stop:319 length:180 start_codon:yes stop_codon:yes gene_type:complete
MPLNRELPWMNNIRNGDLLLKYTKEEILVEKESFCEIQHFQDFPDIKARKLLLLLAFEA